jgi:hypothetical protein
VCYVILVRRLRNSVGRNVRDGSGRGSCISGIDIQGSLSSDGLGQCFSKWVTPKPVVPRRPARGSVQR